MRMPVLVGVLMAVALVGCNKTKKVAKTTEPDSAPPAQPAPAGGSTGSGGEAIMPAGGVGVVVNPQAALGGGGGGGAAQAVRKAARRTQALNEMNTLGQVITLMQTDTGRMPTKEQIVAELKQYPQVLAAINEGAFVLTGTTEAGGLWAYEVDADKSPGIALIGGKATRSTPEELAPYFARQPKTPTSSRPNTTPAPGQPSAAPAAPAAAVGKQDMEDIRIYVDNRSGASGQMPTVQEVYAALTQAQSPAATLVYKQAITLTGAKTREGIWAFETAALQRGGLVCGSNGTETVTADDLKRRLGVR